jgi:RHS repeat-associated protein
MNIIKNIFVFVLTLIITSIKAQGIRLCDEGFDGVGYRQYNASVLFPLNGIAEFQWTVNNGEIMQYNSDPYAGPIYAQVQWYGNGTLTIVEKSSGQSYTYYYDDLGTCWASPSAQKVLFTQQPCEIKASEFCVGGRNPGVHSYQWQESNDEGFSWNDIAGAIGRNYLPPVLANYEIKVYRRKTIVTGNGTYYTNAAYVTHFANSAGQISVTGSSVIPYNSRPEVAVTLASIKECSPFPNGYNYTWQYSVNNGTWIDVGSGPVYPATAPPIISNNTRIRRRVQGCNQEYFYSNFITLNISYNSPNFENLNYIRENAITVKGIQGWEQADALPTGQKQQTTIYQDGLGRTIQTVGKEMSLANGQFQDMVSLIAYDQFGREPNQYLGYPSSTNGGFFKPQVTAFAEQTGYYAAPPMNETHAYTRIEFENSPSGRVKKVYKPGFSWGGANKGRNEEISVNTVSDDVKIWGIGFNETDLPEISGVYSPGQLIKSIATDEKGIKVITYTDRTGNIILKKHQKDNTPGNSYPGWSCTFYVYDDLGQLRFVIPAKAVEFLYDNNWPILQNVPEIVDELCFKHFYDAKGREIITKVPGKKQEVSVFNKRDQLVLMQDGNLLRDGNWMYYLYDKRGRKVATGIFNNPGKTRQQYQIHVDNLNVGEVTITANTNIAEFLTVYNPVAGSATYCDNCINLKYHEITYYDGYDYPGTKPFNPNVVLGYAADPGNQIEPTESSKRTIGLVTGAKTAVIYGQPTVPQYLTSTNYYDDAGRPLQRIEDNLAGGAIETTSQYDFSDKLMSISSQTTLTGKDLNQFGSISKNTYDVLGRLMKEEVNFNNAGYKTINEYSYNTLGQINKNRLGINPLPGGAELETQYFTYNLHGSLTAINKDYALKTGGLYNKWQHYFGYYLGYDDRDNVFGNSETAGNIAGQLWNTQGDDAQRRYVYQYDSGNRVTGALFTQKDKVNNAWENSRFDFGFGTSYDANGNILTLLQKGVQPGEAPRLIDNLSYTYLNNGFSNRLRKVTDLAAGPMGNANGKSGDFKDGTNGNSDDYTFDDNGNINKDLNKDIKELAGQTGGTGISYTIYDKPFEVAIPGKGTIKHIYEAGGTRLQKVFTPTAAGPSITTDYVGSMVFENNQLVQIQTEFGRLRVIAPYNNGVNYLNGNISLANGKALVFDYFLRDYLGNTRVVLTEETQRDEDMCQGEASTFNNDQLNFGQLLNNGAIDPANNEVKNTRTATPTPWKYNATTNPYGTNFTNYCFGLINNIGQTPKTSIGPNRFLKVMAGDVIKASSHYYYAANPGSQSTNSLLGPLVASLTGAFNNGQAAGIVKDNASPLATSLQANPDNLPQFLTTQSGIGLPTTPKAYLNVLFFDEQMNYVGNSGFADRVSTPGNAGLAVQTPLQGLKAPKNGYVFVFVSNETETEKVYFDDVWVQHERGRIVEETHYYPYGLKIAGISSRKLGAPNQQNGQLQNRRNYQSPHSEEDDFTGWNDFTLRSYDPQLGRWTGADPMDEFESPYVGMGNNPISATDPSGGSTATPPDWYAYRDAQGAHIVKYEGVTNAELNINGNRARRIGGDNLTKDQAWAEYYKNPITFTVRMETATVQANMPAHLAEAKRINDKFNNYSNNDWYRTFGLMVDQGATEEQIREFYSNLRLDYVARQRFDKELFLAFYYKRCDEFDDATLSVLKEGVLLVLPYGRAGKWLLKGGGKVIGFVRGAKGAGEAAKGVATGAQYSVAFETKLANNLYPGKGYYTHFKAANTSLSNAMASDAAFANSMSKLGISIPRSSTGSILGKSPANWVWHHDVGAGVMQLVPKAQHTTGSMFWNTMHPGGVGGMSIWGR